MERIERKELLNKINKNNKYTGISFVIFIVFIITIIIYSIINDHQPKTINVLLLFMEIMVFVSPLFVSMWLLMKNQTYRLLYNRETRRILSNSQKVRVGLFWNLIKKHKYIEAKCLYNYDNYITDESFRVLCNGILIGTMKLYGDSDDLADKSNERMNKYLTLKD